MLNFWQLRPQSSRHGSQSGKCRGNTQPTGINLKYSSGEYEIKKKNTHKCEIIYPLLFLFILIFFVHPDIPTIRSYITAVTRAAETHDFLISAFIYKHVR